MENVKTPAHKPLIAVHGSYYGYNFGDTLLCALFTKWVQEAGAEVLLPKSNAINRQYIGAEYRGVQKLHEAKALIFCGGGYFGEAKKWDWKLPRNYFRHILLAERVIAGKLPLYILAIGAGPLSQKWMRNKVLNIAKTAETLVVRDEPSQQFFKKYGLKREIPIETDAALALTPAQIPTEFQTWAQKNVPKNKPLLFIHLTRQYKHLPAILAAISTFLAKNPTIQPVIITDSLTRQYLPFYTRKSGQDITANLVENALKPFSTLRFNHTGNPWQLCALLNCATVIITHKLHVGIVGTALRKYVISLPHHQKTPRFYKQLGLFERCLQDETFTETAFQTLLKNGFQNPKTDWAEVETRVKNMPYKNIIKSII